MDNGSNNANDRNEYLFRHLVAMFQALALQQLGKIVNPMTGEMERDLTQARITIDILQMIKDKTEGNLNGNEDSLINGVLTELQLNYVDELKSGDGKENEEGEPDETGVSGGDGSESEQGAGDS